MARLRWLENARTGDEGTVCTHNNKLFFDDTNAYIYASASATLDLVATTVAITGNLTVSGSVAKAGTEIPTATTYLGPLTVGVNDLGHDVIFYGATSGNYFHWDQSGDDLLLVGTATQFSVAGTTNAVSAVTGSIRTAGGIGIVQDLWVGGASQLVGTLTCAAITSTGAVSLTGTVAIAGNITIDAQDQINFEDTGAYIHASSTNTLALVGTNITLTGIVGITGATTLTGNVDIAGSNTFTVGTGAITLQGAIGTTKAIVISPATTGTFLDFELETEWVSGVLIRADFGGATTLTGAAKGIVLDFSAVHVDSDQDITAIDLTFPDLTFDAVSKSIKGVEISGDTITVTTSGVCVWTGIDITIPALTETAGTLTGTGVKIVGGTLTTDPICYGVHMSGYYTTGIALTGTYSTAAIASTSVTGFLTTATFVPDSTRTNYALAVGTTAAELDVTMVSGSNKHVNAIQMNINIVGTAPTTSTINLIHSLITHDGVDMPNLRLKCADWNIVIAKQVKDAYVIQTEMDVSGTTTISGEAYAASFYLDVADTITCNSRMGALLLTVSGSGAVTADSSRFNVAHFNAVGGSDVDNVLYLGVLGATATNAIYIENTGTCATAIKIAGTYTTGIDIAGTFTVAGISMNSATFAAEDNEIEMRNNVAGDKTIIASGAATSDGAIVTAVGADADIADGSLYMSCTDSGGVLFIKKDDVWTAFTNP